MKFLKRLKIPTWVMLTLLIPAIGFGFNAINASSVNLGMFDSIQCSTNMTCTKVGKYLKLVATSASLALAGGETIGNATDDTIKMTSDDEALILRVEGFEAKSATLALAADDGDDTADVYSLIADTSDVLTLKNGVTTLQTMSSSGDITYSGSTPYLTVGDNGAEDSGLVFDGAANDWNISHDESAGFLVIGKGTAAGTTDAIRIDTNQLVTMVKDLKGSAASLLYGFSQKQVASTTVAITSSQCGQSFVSNSADTMVLPEASTVLGCRLTFFCANAGDFIIDPADGTDTIGPVYTITGANTTVLLSPSAGDAVQCTDLGMSLTLEAVGNDLWYVVSENGVWTDVN